MANTRSVPASVKVQTEDLRFWYGETEALKAISMDIHARRVTALIGPSGCGKSTFLRCLNRMNELIPNTRIGGRVLVDGHDIYRDADPAMVRRRVGMVFQKPNPFPKSIYKNIIWGPLINGFKGNKQKRDELVEWSLRQAALWDEVKDRLGENANNLSGGQQQRLCIARALTLQPDILLMDEPTSALDPGATAKLEHTLLELKKHYTIIIVTHNMQQAARISDATAFFYLGNLIEMSDTKALFSSPREERTEQYISGSFG